MEYQEFDHQESLNFLAQELSGLSMAERDTVLHDIHGVADVQEEDQNTINAAFVAFDQCWEEQKSQNWKHPAVRLDPGHVKGMRLVFLRRFQMDAAAAAACMLQHFLRKLELFGETKLNKKILLEDLDADDLGCLYNGHCQLLTERDRAGRAIIIDFEPFMQYETVDNQVRAIYYLFWLALEDEETQKMGAVGISYHVQSSLTRARHSKPLHPSFLIGTIALIAATPIRFVAAHFCFNDALHLPMVTFAQRLLGQFMRLRSRLHIGSQQECMYDLMTFGIPSRVFPLTTEGALDNRCFRKFLANRRMQEARGGGGFTIVVPARYDVLFGRGRAKQEHPGMLRLHYWIDEMLATYDKSNRKGKTQLATEIVRMVKNSGRFLKVEDGMWKEVDDEVAREKVSHTFRSRRPPTINNHRRPEQNLQRKVEETNVALARGKLDPQSSLFSSLFKKK